MTMTTHARVTTHAMVAVRRCVSCAHVPGDNDALTAIGTDGLRPMCVGLTCRIYSSSPHSLKPKRTQMTAKGDRVGVRVRASANASSEPVVISLKVDGMMCDGCAESVETCLKKAEGVSVSAVDVNLDTKIVKVSVDCASVVEGLTKLPALVEAVRAGGFEAEPEFD